MSGLIRYVVAGESHKYSSHEDYFKNSPYAKTITQEHLWYEFRLQNLIFEIDYQLIEILSRHIVYDNLKVNKKGQPELYVFLKTFIKSRRDLGPIKKQKYLFLLKNKPQRFFSPAVLLGDLGFDLGMLIKCLNKKYYKSYSSKSKKFVKALNKFRIISRNEFVHKYLLSKNKPEGLVKFLKNSIKLGLLVTNEIDHISITIQTASMETRDELMTFFYGCGTTYTHDDKVAYYDFNLNVPEDFIPIVINKIKQEVSNLDNTKIYLEETVKFFIEDLNDFEVKIKELITYRDRPYTNWQVRKEAFEKQIEELEK